MADIDETALPGIGVRHEFLCVGGARVGVITRHSGRRELVIYDERDPDAVSAHVELSAEESRVLAELLGGTKISERVQSTVRQLEGLAMDWLPVPPTFSPRTIGGVDMRQETGVSIIAVVRDDHPLPAPGPDHELQPGDTLVVTGTPAGIARAARLLET